MRKRNWTRATSSRSCAWSAAARAELATLLPDRRLNLSALVPRLGAGSHLHRALVPLARQQHAVAWPRDLDGTLDRSAPVEHDLLLHPTPLPVHPPLPTPPHPPHPFTYPP